MRPFLLGLCMLSVLSGWCDPSDTSLVETYGFASWQNQVLNMECLHSKGFTGKGITIAHFDDGFNGIDTLGAFGHVFRDSLLKGTWDFVYNRPIEFSKTGTHGAHTLSVISAYQPGFFVGTAYGANILLAHTEDSRSETHQEEINWKNAVYWADSMGADIITSSLGYAMFDQGEVDYTLSMLNGDTAIITKAADEASLRGILVVVPAGNSGREKWQKVTFPGDAHYALTVGAVDSIGKVADFSGRGPTTDGRIKPDVAAMGRTVFFLRTNGEVAYGSGTSFSTPMMAGLAACLMEAHPERTNTQVISAIRQSANQYDQPDNDIGYGIPDACIADSILGVMDDQANGNIDLRPIVHGTITSQISATESGVEMRFDKNAWRKNKKQRPRKVIITNLHEELVYEARKFKTKTKENEVIFKSDFTLQPGNYILKVYYRDGPAGIINMRVK